MAKKSSDKRANTDKRAKTSSRRRLQYAALPYRSNGKSELEVMLVTSRGTQRWIIPKGWPKIGLPPHRTAEEEAYEEAGVAGKVSKKRIGSYSYDKVVKRGLTTSCRVQVFPLRVTRQHKQWPEKHQRETRWYRPRDAARFVKEPSLRRLIRKFAKQR
jgi:8-oxo-dGTP pyrophosphatase MutT (NUDIX family)